MSQFWQSFLKYAVRFLRVATILFLALLIHFMTIAQGLLGFYLYRQFTTENVIEMGPRVEVMTADVPQTGGTIRVNNPASEIHDLNIEISENTFERKQNFEISTSPLVDQSFHEGFQAITPVITIDNNHKVGKEPMLLSLPVDVRDDEFAMFFYYNQDGSLEPLPFVSLDNGVLTAQTIHFSNVVALKTEKANLDDVDINTYFTPGVDDWAFPNKGSQIAPRGHCSGQTATMAYYYIYKKKDLGMSIRDKFDNNRLDPKTITLGYDDSLGYRLSSVTQTNADFQNAYYAAIRNLIHRQQSFSHQDIYYSFAMPMLLNGEPLMMSIRQREVSGNNIQLKYGHAILIYRITGKGLYVADPNYPGQQKYIPYNGTTLGPYETSYKNGLPTRQYNSFANVAISGIYDMATIGRNFTEAEKDVNASTIGNSQFSNTGLQVLVDYRLGRPVYRKNNGTIEIEREAMERIKERYKDEGFIPDDWMDRNYIIIRCISEEPDTLIRFYRGSEKLKDVTPVLKKNDRSYFIVDIGEDRKDLGFNFLEKTSSGLEYIHFRRLSVSVGPVDFEGKWDGYAQITDASNSRWILEIIFELAIRIGEAIGNMIVSMFFIEPDPPMTDAEVQAEVDEAIDSIDWSEILIPVTLDIGPEDNGTYEVTYTIILDEEDPPIEASTTAKERNGKLVFNVVVESLVVRAQLRPVETGRLSGDFDLSVGPYYKLLIGKCDLVKEESDVLQ